MKLLSFDIEIADIFTLKSNEDIEKYGPFHISVASAVIYQGNCELWYSKDDEGYPKMHLSKEYALEMLYYLRQKQGEGYMVCAWNGLKFDLRWIGHTAENMELAAKVALQLYDPMFQFYNKRGFPISLESVAEGMGIKLKKTMKGEDAPIEWQKGNYQKVMGYVLTDSQITNEIIMEIYNQKRISWITKNGIKKHESIPKLKTVEEVLKDPKPDQSWMDNPMPREKFYSWFPFKGKG